MTDKFSYYIPTEEHIAALKDILNNRGDDRNEKGVIKSVIQADGVCILLDRPNK